MEQDDHERLRAGVDERSFELHWLSSPHHGQDSPHHEQDSSQHRQDPSQHRQVAGREAPEPGGDDDRGWLFDAQLASPGGLPPTNAARTTPVAWIGTAHAAGRRAAVLLVPDSMAGVLLRNGLPLAAGLHLVAHADRLEHGAMQVWLSFDRAPREEPFDPERHGADLRCARTKARLKPGEAVVRCPGRPAGAPCELVYRAAAWSAAPRCHGCGRAAAQPAWSPPTPRPERNGHDLLRRALDIAGRA